MKYKLLLFLVFFFTVSFNLPGSKQKNAGVTISAEELKLYNLIMEYRHSKKLPKIPLSKSLTYVAQTHCKDLSINKPDRSPGCNAHSWSDKGTWSSCCYTADHKQSSCMWNKPKELTNYAGHGFEIACSSSDDKMTAVTALECWKKSYHHNNVIVNRDVWKKTEWNAVGVGIYNGISTVWFGKLTDREGEPSLGKEETE
jgi:hypothetical protein